MSIIFEKDKKIFNLSTENTTYMIGLSPERYVGHIYYGRKLNHACGRYLLRMEEYPGTPSVNAREKAAFLDSFAMEYPSGGTGDFRESALEVTNHEGRTGCELFYREHRILKGKPGLLGLPASFGTEEEVSTLEITCFDPVLDLEAVLQYSVFPAEDIITRSVRLKNCGKVPLVLEKAYSACLDMDNQDFEMLSLCGAWARERHIQKEHIAYGRQSVRSIRGCSSHQEHPFIALLTPGTDQEKGQVYAMHFIYSGNFLAQAERTPFDQIRMTMGINPERFRWNLEPQEEFQTPEAVLNYSAEGLGKMTRSFHDFYRNHLIRSPYKYKKRPILINNWEATYFDFDSDKLIAIAKEAKKNGIEMLVMDDGWFGRRNSDNNSLGDWFVNEDKLKGGLPKLVEAVRALGMEFGIWFEPEMISPDSDLYRRHPDWAIQIKGRTATMSREQYILDITRKEVRDYAYECVASILRSAPVSYVKWDMNRQMTDIGSSCLSRERQGELAHRYILGVYEMQERLVSEFPDLLLENCSGGGARFDPGMLYYSPQIWCSDDTDAIERLRIQEGTALIYPLSAMGAHVSDCPNHALGRTTPFETRAHVALAGTFGYELDITRIPEEDRAMIPAQTDMCRKYQPLIQRGDYYRLASWSDQKPWDCYEVAAKDGREALVTWVQVLSSPSVHSHAVCLKGLDPEAVYQLEGTEETWYGEELMNCGYLFTPVQKDFTSRLLHFVACEN